MSDLPTLLVNDADGVRTPTLKRGARRNAIDTALGTAVLAALRKTADSDPDSDVRSAADDALRKVTSGAR